MKWLRNRQWIYSLAVLQLFAVIPNIVQRTMIQREPAKPPGNDPCYWSLELPELMARLGTGVSGLTGREAERRLPRLAANRMGRKRRGSSLLLLLTQFKSPITLILIASAGLSLYLGDVTDALIILAIVLASALLGFWQEKGAAAALEKLLALVAAQTTVLRDGRQQQIATREVVPGDLVLLAAGAMVPGDCRLVQGRDLFINEAALTGETFPVEKHAAVLPEAAPVAQRTNVLYLGTHVVSGTGQALVVQTGRSTQFGRISQRLELRPPETEFELGIRRFGFFLLEVTLLLVLAIFAGNVLLARPVLESVLFSLALAVGLTPQLLPAIISVNLAHGARRMAQRQVIVRRLASIENFGSMNVLCSDKTGTLTEGTVHVYAALDTAGRESLRVLEMAYVNSTFESGFANPLDEAVRKHRAFDLSGYEKLDEIPYDFLRKRLSILVRRADQNVLITKGALENVLQICDTADMDGHGGVPLQDVRAEVDRQFASFSAQGMRVLGVAYRHLPQASVGQRDEANMVFAGFLVLHDPPKQDVRQTIERLRTLGVSLKMITGDNRLVAAQVAASVGLGGEHLLTGDDLRRMSGEALLHRVTSTAVFAEVEPNQKERIILALKKAGQVVGYLGDGINDATALHAADVGISVDSAVDVAKEAADIVLLSKDLDVLVDGVAEGRATFANTLKYVFMATSANFGNMFSMAGASLFLPFLPLLPKQVLLTNLLTDLPEMTIANDRVDQELVAQPRRWDVAFIRKFMLVFGPLSSVFDYLTFAVLLMLPGVSTAQFRTGWLLESVCSACLVVLVIRTRRPCWKSRPGRPLLLATLLVVLFTVALPYTPLAEPLGLAPLAAKHQAILAAIVAIYVASAEVAKVFFYRVRPRDLAAETR